LTQEQDPEDATGFGLGELLSQVQDMQARLTAAQAEAAEMMVEGRAGGGAVVVHVTGALEFRSIKIDPKIFQEGDVTLLEDTILAAINGAMEGVAQLNQTAMHDSGLDELGGLGDLDQMFGGLLGGAGLLEGEAEEDDTEQGGAAAGTAPHD
jgi:DNA-binding YbaB/EbfC family protein